MSELRLKAKHPEEAYKAVFDALAMEKSRLQYSLNGCTCKKSGNKEFRNKPIP